MKLRTLTFAAAALSAGLAPDAARAETPEELILEVGRVRGLARDILEDLAAPLGVVLGHIGSSGTYSHDPTGFGSWSVAIGASGAGFSFVEPDLDPGTAGNDEVQAGVGAMMADASIGLFEGYDPGGSLTNVFSINLLARLGYTIGDQDNIVEKVDVRLRPVVGAGFRIGVLRGAGWPAVSLAVGANHLAERRFSASGDAEEDGETYEYTVDLDLQQTTGFALLEVGEEVGAFTLFGAVGAVRNRLRSTYRSGVVFDTNTASEPAGIGDTIDLHETRGAFFGGAEVGGGGFRVSLSIGATSGEPHGSLLFRIIG